jgi:hypothetical protein
VRHLKRTGVAPKQQNIYIIIIIIIIVVVVITSGIDFSKQAASYREVVCASMFLTLQVDGLLELLLAQTDGVWTAQDLGLQGVNVEPGSSVPVAAAAAGAGDGGMAGGATSAPDAVLLPPWARWAAQPLPPSGAARAATRRADAISGAAVSCT